MEEEVSLSCPYESATGHYSEPDELIPRPYTLPLRSVPIIFFRMCLGVQNGLFLSGFSTKILYSFLICHMHDICAFYISIFDSITIMLFAEH